MCQDERVSGTVWQQGWVELWAGFYVCFVIRVGHEGSDSLEGLSGIPSVSHPGCGVIRERRDHGRIGHVAAGGGEVPCSAVQAATHCIRGEDLRDGPGQFEEGDLASARAVYPGVMLFHGWSWCVEQMS